MRLVVDAMLGRLAKWLRVVGYDTLYWRGDDAGLVRLAMAEDRMVLTRDTRLAPRLPSARCLFIESDHYDEQLCQVVKRLGGLLRIGSRCLRCNRSLEAAAKAEVRGVVPEFVWHHHERFSRCPGCGRTYWEGTHYARMINTLERIAFMGTDSSRMTGQDSGRPCGPDANADGRCD